MSSAEEDVGASVGWKDVSTLARLSFPFMCISLMIPIGVLIILFSDMGLVRRTFLWLHDRNEFSTGIMALAGAAGFLTSVVIMFRPSAKMASFLGFIVRAVLLPTCLIASVYLLGGYPYPALVFSQLTVPLVVDMLRHYVFRAMNAVAFVAEVSLVLYLSGAGAILAWVLWVILDPAEWSQEAEVKYAQWLGCDTHGLGKAFFLRTCPGAFIVWVYPVLIALSCLLSGKALSIIGTRAKSRSQDLAEATSSILADIQQTALIFLIGANLVVLYLASSYAGASGGTLDFVSMFLYLDIAVLLVSLFKALPDIVKTGKPFIYRIASVLTSDTARAAVALVCMPIIFVHLVLTWVLDQASCRARKRRQLSQAPAAEDAAESVEARPALLSPTAKMANMLKNMETDESFDIHWTNVLRKVVALGTLFMTLFVLVGQFTPVILSALNVAIEDAGLDLVTVCAVYFIIGMCMLGVMIPGVPVYIAGGLIIGNAAWREMAFGTAIFLSTVVCFFIKLGAVVLQQVVIGGLLGNRVGVRALVGVNSTPIKAIRRILSAPGWISLKKVAILCGGPDWPTSVLTGILRLSVTKMVVGTLPVYIIIAPCCAAGAFMLRAGEGEPWPMLNTGILTAATLMQALALLAAMYYIEIEIHYHRKDIDKLSDDAAVQEYEAKRERMCQQEDELTNWYSQNFPRTPKVCILVGSLCVSISCYIYVLIPNECFHKFVVTDSISDLPGGKFYNVVQPTGWIAIVFFLFGVTLSRCFVWWVKTHASRSETSVEQEQASGPSTSESAPAAAATLGAIRVTRTSSKAKRAKMVV